MFLPQLTKLVSIFFKNTSLLHSPIIISLHLNHVTGEYLTFVMTWIPWFYFLMLISFWHERERGINLLIKRVQKTKLVSIVAEIWKLWSEKEEYDCRNEIGPFST